MPEVVVRLYEPANQDGIEWLYTRTPPAGQTYVRPYPIDPDLQRIPEVYQAFWVAIEATRNGDAVVGITALDRVGDREVDTPIPAPDFIDTSLPTARLHHVMVVPERQRHGIGRQLIEAVRDWAQAEGYGQLILDTTSEQEVAVEFYRAIGFQELGRSQFKRWEMVWFGMKL